MLQKMYNSAPGCHTFRWVAEFGVTPGSARSVWTVGPNARDLCGFTKNLLRVDGALGPVSTAKMFVLKRGSLWADRLEGKRTLLKPGPRPKERKTATCVFVLEFI